VDNGKVDLKRLTFLSAEEEDIAKIAQASAPLDEKEISWKIRSHPDKPATSPFSKRTKWNL